MDQCPHCGASLPAIDNAFCPECRNALDEPPDHRSNEPISGQERKRVQNRQKHAVWLVFGAITTIGGVFLLLSGEMSGLIGLIGGLILLAEASRRVYNQP
jgi:hypothetical protein